jgi:hypothetical protein
MNFMSRNNYTEINVINKVDTNKKTYNTLYKL